MHSGTFIPGHRSRNNPVDLPRRWGFTLVELLVVLAIIVVLLALFLPTLGKVRYQAKLTVCLSNLRQIGEGAMGFAAANNGLWPGARDPAGGEKANYVYGGGTPDIRTQLSGYIPLNKFFCPLGPVPDQSVGSTAFNYETFCTPGNPYTGCIEWTYSMWFGWGYYGQKANLRVGQGFTYGGKNFHILAGDCQHEHPIDFGAESDHQDFNGAELGYNWNDSTYLMSRWQNWAKVGDNNDNTSLTYQLRGGVDLNFAFDDGSARTYQNVGWQANNHTNMTLIPSFSTGGLSANDWIQTVPLSPF